MREAEGIKTGWQRSTCWCWRSRCTISPEGLAVGVAFGAVSAGLPSATCREPLPWRWASASENFPEGAAYPVLVRRACRA
jgi:ZIP family zinc transporter